MSEDLSRSPEQFFTRESVQRECLKQTGYELKIIPGDRFEQYVDTITKSDQAYIKKNGTPRANRMPNSWPLATVGYTDGFLVDGPEVRYTGSASTCFVGLTIDRSGMKRIFHHEIAFTAQEAVEDVRRLGRGIKWGFYTSGCSSLVDEFGAPYMNAGLEPIFKSPQEHQIAWTGVIVIPKSRQIVIGFPTDHEHLRDIRHEQRR
jgi:hypothetical protein